MQGGKTLTMDDHNKRSNTILLIVIKSEIVICQELCLKKNYEVIGIQ